MRNDATSHRRADASRPTRLLAAATAAALMLILLAPGASRAADSQAPETRSDVSERIDAFVAERMAAHDLPGAAVAVVRDGEVVHAAGYGDADASGRPVTADTPFLIGSVSKPLTATVALRLVEEGALSLDDPVLPYLDGLADDVADGFEDVTVRHLLTHTSGMGSLPGLAGAQRVREGDDALERRAADLLAKPLAAAPGERFAYSNGGYTLLAAVIEEAAGRPFAEVLRDRVLEPLRMTDSFATASDAEAAEVATGHSLWFGRWRPRELPYDEAGASMGYVGSTASDLARFMRAHLGASEQDTVSAELREAAHRRAADVDMGDPMVAGYGMGWFVGELGGHRTVTHSGALGHFATHVNLVPEADGLGVAVLTNASAFAAGQGSDFGLGEGLTRLLLDEEVDASSAQPLVTIVAPLAVWAAAIAVLAGAGRFVWARLPRLRAADPRAGWARRWLRPVALPALGYLALALPLLPIVPLGVARHFAPDIGWGLTVLAWLALGWAVARTALAARAVREASPSSPSGGSYDGAQSRPAMARP